MLPTVSRKRPMAGLTVISVRSCRKLPMAPLTRTCKYGSMRLGNRRLPAASAPALTSTQAAAVAKLKELKSLLNQGLISQSQYQADSQKLLNQIVD